MTTGTHQASSRQDGAALAAVTVAVLALVALLLRLATLRGWVIAGDEFGTLGWIEKPVPEILSTYEGQLTMHLYVLLLKGWALVFGTSPVSLKLPSVLAGVALVPLLYWFGARWVSRPAGLVAALLATVSPMLIQYGRTARVYAVFVLVVTISMACYLRVLTAPRRRTVVALALWNGAALALSLNAAYVMMAQGLHAVLWWAGRPRERGRTLGALLLGLAAGGGLALLFYAAALSDILVFLAKWTGGDRFRVEWIEPTLMRFYHQQRWVLLALLALGGALQLRRHRVRGGLLVLWALLPWVFFVLSSSRHPEPTFIRLVLPSLPAHFLLIGVGATSLAAWATPGRWRPLAPSLALAAVAAFVLLPYDWWGKVAQVRGRPFPAALELLAQRRGPHDRLTDGLIGTERLQQLEFPDDVPPFLELRELARQNPAADGGRLFLLADAIEAAQPYWSERFTCHEIPQGRYTFPLLLLEGRPGSAGRPELRASLRHYLEGMARAGSEMPLDVTRARHLGKLIDVHRKLRELARLDQDDAEMTRQQDLIERYRREKEEVQEVLR